MIEVHQRSSVRSVVVGTAAKLIARPALAWFPVNGPVAPLRHALDVGARLAPRHRDTTVEKVAGDGWHGELVMPKGVRSGQARSSTSTGVRSSSADWPPTVASSSTSHSAPGSRCWRLPIASTAGRWSTRASPTALTPPTG